MSRSRVRGEIEAEVNGCPFEGLILTTRMKMMWPSTWWMKRWKACWLEDLSRCEMQFLWLRMRRCLAVASLVWREKDRRAEYRQTSGRSGSSKAGQSKLELN